MFDHDEFGLPRPPTGFGDRIAGMVGGFLGVLSLPGAVWLAFTRWDQVKWFVIGIGVLGAAAFATRKLVIGSNLFPLFALAATVFGLIGAVAFILGRF